MSVSRHIDGWQSAMERGEIYNRRFSPLTVKDYSRRIEIFLKEYKKINLNTVKLALRAVPLGQQGKALKLYKAVVCFAKYLSAEGFEIDDSLVVRRGAAPEALLNLKPKKNASPKQLTVTAAGLKLLKAACANPFERLVVVLLSTTGLRASEATALTVADCLLDEAKVVVKCGKGGKSRRVALMRSAIKAIKDYLEIRPAFHGLERLLIAPCGKQFSRFDLNHLLNVLGRRAGVTVTPHSLRRAFVTISHAKGAPLDYLRVSCGHEKVEVTMGYCRSQEQDVLDFMSKLELDD